MSMFPEQEIDSLTPFYIAAILVLVTVVCTGLSLNFLFGNLEKQGQFGDMFGVLNTLFSGLAFSALVCTLILQRKELKLQRHELALTRTELQKQASASEEHAKTAVRSAKIAALGSLYQSYSVLISNHKDGHIGPDPYKQLAKVHDELQQLLKDASN